MVQTVTKIPASGRSNGSETKRRAGAGDDPVVSVKDLEVELGLWLSSIESFLGTAAHPFADKLNLRAHDWAGELRLSTSSLVLCSGILDRLTSAAREGETSNALSFDESDALSSVVRDAIVLSESLARAQPLNFGEWRSWCRLVVENLHGAAGFEKAVRLAETAGESAIPERLAELIKKDSVPFGERFELDIIVPGFARILKWLHVVEKMLLADEPLKPSLLIFARVYEDTHDLVGQINRRLLRFPDEDAELFRALDSASYIASIELRKVFDQELAGLATVRSAVTVYARVETAFASLRDNIQQILAGIAKLLEPGIDASSVFPAIGAKLETSLKLRDELATMTRLVRASELDASKEISDAKLRSFLTGPVQTLFYKDRESIERFVEEILRTPDRKDLVPILHRFGAYLETLHNHVNNRAVLAAHQGEQ